MSQRVLSRLILPLVLVSIFALPLNGVQAQVKPARSFDDLAQRAKQARTDNQLEQAISLYQAALSQRPSWAEGWWDLATIEYKLKRYAAARESFHHVTVLNPKSGAAFAFMGLCDYELGRFISALKVFDQGGKLGFGNDNEITPLVLYHVALLLTREGDFERSLDQLKLFVAAGDHDPEIVVALGLGTLRMPLVPTEIPPEKHDLVVKAGEAAWQVYAHNVEDAKELFVEFVTGYPHEPNVHYAYAMYLLDADPQLAFEEFKKELEISPSHNEARLQVAFFYLQQGAPEQSMKLAREVLKVASNDYRVHLVMGRSYLQMDQVTKAIPELKLSAAMAPEDYETRLYLAQAYRNLGNKEAAAREQSEFDRLKLAEKRQTTAAGWWYFASQYYQKHSFHEAQDAFHKITDQSPNDGAAWAMMGLCDFQLADYKNALEHLTKAKQFGLQNAPELESSLHYYLALLLNRAGKFDDAFRQVSWFASQAPVNQQTIEASGINALRIARLPSEISSEKHDFLMKAGNAAWAFNMGQVAEAKSLFEILAATYPNEPNVHYNYGLCLAQSSDLEGAIQEFHKELEITPTHGDAEAHIAFIHLQQSLNDIALQGAQSAVKMAPDSFLTHNALGWALLATRQFDKAVEEMATSVRLAPDTPVTHYSLAQAYKAAGKESDSQKELAKFESLNKDYKLNSAQTNTK